MSIDPDEIGAFSGSPGVSVFKANVGTNLGPRSDGSSAIGFAGGVGTETGFAGVARGGDVSESTFGGGAPFVGAAVVEAAVVRATVGGATINNVTANKNNTIKVHERRPPVRDLPRVGIPLCLVAPTTTNRRSGGIFLVRQRKYSIRVVQVSRGKNCAGAMVTVSLAAGSFKKEDDRMTEIAGSAVDETAMDGPTRKTGAEWVAVVPLSVEETI